MKIFVSRAGAAICGRLLALALCAIAAGCGGGGGSGGGSLPLVSTATGSSSTTTTTTPPATTTATGTNVAAISIDTGPQGAAGQVNIPYVSVTVCAPGGASCQTIDHITVDTGSVGLRLMASALNNRAALTQVTDSSNTPLAECAQFASGFTWGSVKLAKVTIGGLTAASAPVQIIGDQDFNDIPTSCSNTGSAQNSVQSFGSNGLLGVGAFRQDCGSICATRAIAGTYYSCPSGDNCVPIAVPLASQVTNPVVLFASDNNGSLVQLPAIPAAGATNVAGSLIFGIGTRDNNALGAAKAYGIGSDASLVATVGGVRYTDAFFDSGSNFFYFDTTALANCAAAGFAGFYCPATTTLLGVTFQGTNGTTGSASISIANAANQITNNPSGTAFSNIGTQMGETGGFDFGLPFFFGRSVFTAIEGASTPGGTGPYVAF